MSDDPRFTKIASSFLLNTLGMSQQEVAKVLGVSQMTISRDLKQNVSEHETKCLTPRRTTRELLWQSNQNDWRTPRAYLEAAHTVLGDIDLDSAEANETVTEADNGLEKPWKARVWLNPPYGGEVRLFVDRLIAEYQVGNVTAAILLVNSHPTETKWFQQLFDYAVCFVAGRIHFGGPSRPVTSNATHGSAIAYLGENGEIFAEVFSKFGAVVKRIAKVRPC
jgi:predicted transcriptional regulator